MLLKHRPELESRLATELRQASPWHESTRGPQGHGCLGSSLSPATCVILGDDLEGRTQKAF